VFFRVSSGVLFISFLLAANGPAFRSDVTLVNVPTSVYDKKTGASISGLQASDFLIYDNGELRPLAYFGDDSGPLDLVLLLDVSGTMREAIPDLADRATTALGCLAPEDRAAVMAFGKRNTIVQPLTDDFAAVVQAIRSVPNVRVGLDTDINQAIWAAADYLRRSGGRSRRGILILTDNMQLTHVPDSSVEEQLVEADTVLDGLLIRGRVALPHITHSGVLRFAQKTGGEVIEGNQPAARLSEMIQRIKARYMLHFRPAGTASRQSRHIHVELTPEARRRCPEAIIRARSSYFPNTSYAPKSDLPDGRKVSQRQHATLENHTGV
jgi:VWFA-related protein